MKADDDQAAGDELDRLDALLGDLPRTPPDSPEDEEQFPEDHERTADMTPREAVDLVEASIPWKLWAHSPELTAAARVTLDHARAATGETGAGERERLVEAFRQARVLLGTAPDGVSDHWTTPRPDEAERMADVALRALGGATGDRDGRELAELARSWDENAAEERRTLTLANVTPDEATACPYVAQAWEKAAGELRAALATAPQARPEGDGREGSDEEMWSDERPPDEGVSEAGEALLAKLRVEPGRWLRHATNVGIFWPLTDAALEVARLSKLGLIETHHERTTNGLANVWLRITEENHDV